MNFAHAANGGVATASSSYYSAPWLFTPGGANNGVRSGAGWGSGEGWNDNAPGNSFPDWLQIDFSSLKTIDEIDVFTGQDNWQYPSQPTESMTFSLYGLTAFDVQYWNGNAWVTVPGGNITGNNKVWRKITFSSVVTTKIRVLANSSIDGYSRITELEAWGSAPASTNVALAANGGVATASSSYYSAPWLFTPGGANNGVRSGAGWGSGEGWNDNAPGNSFPDWLQIDFSSLKTIDEIDVFTGQDNWQYPSQPTESMTFSLYGLTAFDVQYWNGSAWVTVPGGNITGNNKVWRRITFPQLTTNKIRVLTNSSIDGYSRITELEAWDTPPTGTGSSPSDFALARLDPHNRTGTGGEDLLSNNFNWNLPLVHLPGRGLDLGLTLSYNSLVWVKSGNYIDYDVDRGSVAPGFRIGFPTIEGPYFNSQANANFYLLVAPSGGRVELRQVGSSTIYESKDSSYLQLADNLNGTMTLRPTDGSQMNFTSVGGSWRCNQVKDRNGNYLSVTYKSWGEIDQINDTLGRVLTFNYDANQNIQSITQPWANQLHTWATFGWSTASLAPGFNSEMVSLGPGSAPVLAQVGLADGSRYNFDYTNYGVVSTIHYYAYDPDNSNHERNRVTYTYAPAGTDAPRITQRQDRAEYWTGFNGVPDRVVTSFSHAAGGGCRLTLPDGKVYEEFYGAGWQAGLTSETRNYLSAADADSNVWQKRTTTQWTQDNTNVGYLTNPRVIETNVFDSIGNQRRATIDYGTYAQYGLPYIVKEYSADGSELRHTQTDYNLSQGYISQRIIGLVSAQQLWDAALNEWSAKTTYEYDNSTLSTQATTAAGHDQSFNASFIVRGNVSSISRWDVTDSNNAARKLTTIATYNAAGSAISATDPGGHTNSIDYADSFSDGNNGRATFAYPTKVTDADGFSSFVQFNFDFGAKTRVEGPPPQNQPNGSIQTFNYDAATRLERVTMLNNGAYRRYVYGPYWVQSFSTVNTISDEAYSMTTFDGMGRAFTTTTNHPGSVGGYKLVNVIYDQRGRPFLQSNPTEVNSAWLPAGDDADGVHYSLINYDWKGRAIQVTNPDGTYTAASYTGCGCAGGEVVTLTDEVGRRQKIYSDVLGRQRKTEVLNWDGSVYATTTNSLNARDQITLIRQWAGAENAGGPYQDTATTYDGYGRLQSRHVPEQNPGTSTIYAYNSDDTIHAVTDARGASTTYSYNNGRHLLNQISYEPGNSGVPDTPDASFGYDAAGNRISMSDGLGSQSYTYDSLSRLTSETRTFTGVGSFTLSYGYNLEGKLKSINDPWSGTINYGIDSAGRLNNITGSGYGSVTQLASNMRYRAWGSLKSEAYGNGFSEAASYNTRMQMTNFDVRNSSGTAQMSSTTQYYADGQAKFSHNTLDERFDRAFAYDHDARITEAYSGSEARDFVNNTSTPNPTGPFRQSYQFNPFDNLTVQANRLWNDNEVTNNTYTNNRNASWYYDAAGFPLVAGGASTVRDAAGRAIAVTDEPSYGAYSFDGEAHVLKSVITTWRSENAASIKTRYFLRSTVLGATVAELDSAGTRTKRYFFAGRRAIAEERLNGTNYLVTWLHDEPLTGTRGESDTGGTYAPKAEFNADGIDVGFSPPAITGFNMPDRSFGFLGRGANCSAGNPNCVTCYLDKMEFDCGSITQLAMAGGLQVELQNSRGDKKYVDLDVVLGRLVTREWVEDNNPQDNTIYQASGEVKDDEGNPIESVIYGTNAGHWKSESIPTASFDAGERRFAHGQKPRKIQKPPVQIPVRPQLKQEIEGRLTDCLASAQKAYNASLKAADDAYEDTIGTTLLMAGISGGLGGYRTGGEEDRTRNTVAAISMSVLMALAAAQKARDGAAASALSHRNSAADDCYDNYYHELGVKRLDRFQTGLKLPWWLK